MPFYLIMYPPQRMAAKSDCMRKSKLGDALDVDSGNVSHEREGLENLVAYALLIGGQSSDLGGDLGGQCSDLRGHSEGHREARRAAAKSVHARPAERGRWAVLTAAAAADSCGKTCFIPPHFLR